MNQSLRVKCHILLLLVCCCCCCCYLGILPTSRGSFSLFCFFYEFQQDRFSSKKGDYRHVFLKTKRLISYMYDTIQPITTVGNRRDEYDNSTWYWRKYISAREICFTIDVVSSRREVGYSFLHTPRPERSGNTCTFQLLLSGRIPTFTVRRTARHKVYKDSHLVLEGVDFTREFQLRSSLQRGVFFLQQEQTSPQLFCHLGR